MTGLEALPAEKRPLIGEIVEAAASTPGVAAVALGGSYARSAAHADSDVDLGLYYEDGNPFAIDDIRALAARFHHNGELVVTQLYEWGPWVNGGAWLQTSAGRVDLLYRSLEHVERVIAAASRGELEWHFGQQPPYGFRSVIYLAETAVCLPLADPRGALSRLKRMVDVYPEAMRAAIVRTSLWGAEFTLFHGGKFAAAGDVYNAAGCMTRVACELTQALFALNRVYYIGDKPAPAAIESFALKPNGYDVELDAILARPGADAAELSASMSRLVGLVSRVIACAGGDLYAAKYPLPV